MCWLHDGASGLCVELLDEQAADVFRLLNLNIHVCFGIFMMALLNEMMYMRWTNILCTYLGILMMWPLARVQVATLHF